MVFVWELPHFGPGRASDEFLTEFDGNSSPSEIHLRCFGWFLCGNSLMLGPAAPRMNF